MGLYATVYGSFRVSVTRIWLILKDLGKIFFSKVAGIFGNVLGYF